MCVLEVSDGDQVASIATFTMDGEGSAEPEPGDEQRNGGTIRRRRTPAEQGQIPLQ